MINWDRISELQAEVGEDGFTEVVEIFLDEMAEGVDSLQQSKTPSETLEKLHFLKGSAQNIGLEELSSLCAGHEVAIRGGDSSPLDILPFRKALDHARQEFGAL